MAEATALRTEEKAKNAQTVKDAQAAQVAVAQALQAPHERPLAAATGTTLYEKGREGK